MKIVFHAAATHELEQSTQWLEDRVPGLGAKFTVAARNLLASIQANPVQFSPILGSRHDENFRVGFIRRFGYSVYFTIFPERELVFIFAVQHGRRSLARLRTRLENLDFQDE